MLTGKELAHYVEKYEDVIHLIYRTKKEKRKIMKIVWPIITIHCIACLTLIFSARIMIFCSNIILIQKCIVSGFPFPEFRQETTMVLADFTNRPEQIGNKYEK
ncbi:uncharacterized protein ZBAI_01327 [Zygosaccharomyces bailii ISA1307]|nr:uncharacterized protein ZBAI_01327 [Zygosaccharomyces bailii ISA1307]